MTKNSEKNCIGYSFEAEVGKSHWLVMFRDGTEHEVSGTFEEVLAYCREVDKNLDNPR